MLSLERQLAMMGVRAADALNPGVAPQVLCAELADVLGVAGSTHLPLLSREHHMCRSLSSFINSGLP